MNAESTAGILIDVAEQHAADAAHLWHMHSRQVRAPHVALRHLARLHERLSAHLDGLLVAGRYGLAVAGAMLESAAPDALFVMTVAALESQSLDDLERAMSIAEAVPACRPGLLGGMGWVEPARLQGIATSLLSSKLPYRRALGLMACGIHRVDPGRALLDGFGGAFDVQVAALRAAGELGVTDAMRHCIGLLDAADARSRFWAAWAAVLLGDRAQALSALIGASREPGPFRSQAFRLAMQLLNREAIREALLPLARDDQSIRWAVDGAAISGDPSYVTWLIGLMSDDQISRFAGESFTLITGADLALLDLERKPPQGAETGPTDDPNEPNVDLDPDDGLAWPDQGKVSVWWAHNASRFAPGTRYFVGEPLSREQCVNVLKVGYQRQRILAAHFLCLLAPGTVLFNTSAPAWRQKQLLAKMG